MLAVAYCLLQVQHALAASPEAFKFTKVDLELLQQTNQADNELERNGLVFDDPDRQIKTTMRHDVPLEILVGRARTAVAIATRLTEMDSDDAENAFLLGELYRAMGGRTPRPLPDELTESAKKNTRKQLFKMTPQECEKALLATPAGKAAWTANVTSAERAYQHALTSNPQYAPAVAGLAALYDADEKPVEAHEQYLKYLELAPAAKDAYRIRKRADELEKKPGVAISGNTNSN